MQDANATVLLVLLMHANQQCHAAACAAGACTIKSSLLAKATFHVMQESAV